MTLLKALQSDTKVTLQADEQRRPPKPLVTEMTLRCNATFSLGPPLDPSWNSYWRSTAAPTAPLQGLLLDLDCKASVILLDLRWSSLGPPLGVYWTSRRRLLGRLWRLAYTLSRTPVAA